MTTTSTHGIARVAKADNLWVKLAWTVMIIASVSFGLNTISKQVADYYKHDVITNIASVQANNFTVPSITICSRRIFSTEFYDHGSLSRKEITFGFSLSDIIDFSKSNFKGLSLLMFDLEFFEISHSYGDCVRFNGPQRNGKVQSTCDSLTFHFNKNTSLSSSEFLLYNSSFYFYVQDNYIDSFLNTERFYLKKDKSYYININKAYTEKKLGEPYNNCSGSLDETYHQENCIEQCINSEINKKYNCSIPSYYKDNAFEVCHRPKEFNTIYEYSDDLYKQYYHFLDSHESIIIFLLQNLTTEFQEACEKNCQRECESSKINVQIQVSKETGDSTELHFVISDLATLEITQIPKMGSFDLVSSIGGTLGLCVGISLLSFVEILEFFFDVLLISVA